MPETATKRFLHSAACQSVQLLLNKMYLTAKIFRKSTEYKNENENRNEAGEDTYAGALRVPRASSPAFVSVFVFV